MTAGEFGQAPPHDAAAEQVVLGAMMLSADAIADVAAVPLLAFHHYRPAHQIIHEAILELDACGSPADVVSVADLLTRQGRFMQAGGGNYLHDLLAMVPVAVNAGHYARIVREKADLRAVIEAGTRMVQLAYEGYGDAAEITERGREVLDTALSAVRTNEPPAAGDVFRETLDMLESRADRGLPTPWPDLNQVIPGLGPGEFIVIGASSGTGKSIAGLNLAAHVALQHKTPAVIFTMEMTRHEVMQRLIAAEARVPLRAMVRRELDDSHWERIAAVHERIAESPLVIDDTPGMSVATIRARLRQMARTAPAALVFVDYLGLLREPPKAENRQNAVAYNTRALKEMAGEFGIPVIAAAQLNREAEHRKSKVPQPSDLRDSAEIEHAASVIILLHREDVHGEETPRSGEIDFIVAKNRNGLPATVILAFQGTYARAVSMAAPAWSPSSVLGGGK